MNNNFYYNDSNNNQPVYSNSQKNLLLIFASIILIAIGYVMMISGMFDKVSKVETTIDNKIVYQGKDEIVRVKVDTNSEFNPVVKFRSKNGKFIVSENRQEGKEVETKIIAKESGEDILIVEVGRDEGKKDKKEEIKILICEEPKLLNTTDKTLSMKEETNLQLKFNVDDKCLEGYQIYVENDKLADIDNNYLLNAKKSGKTTLVLKGSNKTIKYTLNDKPLRVNVTGVKINTKNFNLAIGKTKNLSVTVKPSDATNKKVTYESSDTNIATVTSSGKVKGISTGVATITVTTEENSKTDIVKVKVYKPEPPVSTLKVESIKFDKTSESVYVGESKNLTTTISPSNATNKTITCTSSNNSIATVSVSGNACVVKGVAAGTTTITATTKDGNKKATASVTISNKPVTTISVTGIKFDKTSESMYVGESKSLTATISPSNATNKTITCTSSNNNIATVSASSNACVVKGVASGTVAITATTKDGNKVTTSSVTINNRAVPVVSVTGIKFDKTSESMYVGESKNLTTTISPSNATNKAITCTSSNNSVATVSVSGNSCVVKGVKAGTATITATTKDGNKVTTSSVTINNKPAAVVSVTGVKFDKTSESMYVGESKSLTATISPSNAANKGITCTSSNNSVATVSVSSNACVVKGVAAGTVTITVTTKDGNKIATSSVTISNKPAPVVKVTGIKFDKTKESVYVGESKSLTATISPSNATNKAITCTSSNDSIATASVSGNSCVVKGVKAGTAKITVTTSDGNKKATASVSVSNKPVPVISVTGIKFDKASESMYVGESKSLTATISPSNAANKTITCKSSDTKIATAKVSSNACVVKGVKAGTVTITATTKDGNKTATASVTINNKPAPVVSVTSIKFEKSSYSITLNQTVVAAIGIKPSNAANKTITCKSLNTGIATVTYSGNNCTIKGVKAGTTTIEAYSVDGNKKATTKITVKPIALAGISFENASYSMNVGASKIINVKFNPTNASNQVISCASSNNSIATAVARGASCVVEGVAAGSVTITATSQDGNKKAQATVTCIGQTTNVNINNGLKIYYLALGRIDGILIQGNGTTIFIDGGLGSHGQRCVEFMKEIGITKLDAIIGSHMHDNHINAHTVIADNFPVGAAYYPDDPRTCKANKTCGDGVEKANINRMVNKLNEKNVPINILTPKMDVKIGNLTFDILGPLVLETKVNNNSLHMILKYGNQKFYFSGDSGHPVFKAIYNKYDHNVFANITIFKHPHHGQNEVPSDFITVMNPKYVVVPGNTKSKAGSEYKELDTVIYLLEGALADKKTVITGAGANLKGYLLVEADGKNIKITDKRK